MVLNFVHLTPVYVYLCMYHLCYVYVYVMFVQFCLCFLFVKGFCGGPDAGAACNVLE